jgi:hypothetical protein
MITVIHGEDTESSYKRLVQILSSFKDYEKIHLDQKSSIEDLNRELLGTSLIEKKKVLILKDYFSKQKQIPRDIFLNKPDNVELIIYENTFLTKGKISKLPKSSKIETFKPEPKIFYFLDKIYPKNKKVIEDLFSLNHNQTGLLWQIENRVLLMILSQIGIKSDEASKITKRNILDWQWKKIKDQSDSFDLKTLVKLYNATLKIDLMTKSGKSNLSETSLTNIMLLKYLEH